MLREIGLFLGLLVFTGVAFGGLLLAPFLDPGKERRFYRSPIASSLMLLSLAAVVYLTNVAWTHYQHELKQLGTKPEHIQREEEAQRNGKGSSYFQCDYSKRSCHRG